MYSTILVPVALDHDEAAQRAIEIAKNMVDPEGSITLLNVVEDIPAYAQTLLPDGVLQENEESVHHRMAALADADPAVTKAVVVHGKASTAILNYATSQGTDCIVIASHKPGLEDYFIGSTAYRIVRYARCCVHVIR